MKKTNWLLEPAIRADDRTPTGNPNPGYSELQNSALQFGFNRQRRAALKSVASIVAVAGTVTVPGLAGAIVQRSTDALATDTVNALDENQVQVEFSDPSANGVDGLLARVSISNSGESEIYLHHLSPGVVATRDGVYDINSRLAQSPVAVGPSGTYHFWISPVNAAPAERAAPEGIRTMVQLQVVTGHDEVVSAQHSRKVHAVMV